MDSCQGYTSNLDPLSVTTHRKALLETACWALVEYFQWTLWPHKKHCLVHLCVCRVISGGSRWYQPLSLSCCLRLLCWSLGWGEQSADRSRWYLWEKHATVMTSVIRCDVVYVTVWTIELGEAFTFRSSTPHCCMVVMLSAFASPESILMWTDLSQSQSEPNVFPLVIHPSAHTAPIHARHNLIPLDSLIRFKRLVVVVRSLHSLGSCLLDSLFSFRCNSNRTSTATRAQVTNCPALPDVRTRSGLQSLSYTATKEWL